MDEIKVLKKQAKKKYYYFNDNEVNNLIISNKDINNFDFSSYSIILNNGNIVKYKKNDIIVEIIYDLILKN